MSNEEMMQRLLSPYGPKQPLAQLVVEVNRIYHSFEARDYDTAHPEITRQLPPIWRDMIAVATGRAPGASWHVLDFGCGTGFEAEQLARNLPAESIGTLLCYDPSPEMLAICRKRISPLVPSASFTTDYEAVVAHSGQPFTLLATNSLLHHLPEPLGLLENLAPALSADALWLAGHEPSARYYRNPECASVYASYLRQRGVARFLSPANYARRLQRALGQGRDPVMKTARKAHEEGLFSQMPSRAAIDHLVDFHVAHSTGEAEAGRGLDIEAMEKSLAGKWRKLWSRSYAFMGPFYEGNLPARWSREAANLSAQYPNDGANFSSVWVRER